MNIDTNLLEIYTPKNFVLTNMEKYKEKTTNYRQIEFIKLRDSLEIASCMVNIGEKMVFNAYDMIYRIKFLPYDNDNKLIKGILEIVIRNATGSREKTVYEKKIRGINQLNIVKKKRLSFIADPGDNILFRFYGNKKISVKNSILFASLKKNIRVN